MRPYVFIVLLACTPHKRPRVYAPAAATEATTEPAAPSTEGDDASQPTETPAATSTDPAAALPDPVRAPASAGEAAAYCLLVGADHRAVRCFWSRGDCEGQIAFNKNMDEANTQECRAAAEVHCLKPADGSEICYPTAGDCQQTVANMRKRNRQTSDCKVKKGP